jgi:hypothetical protein
MKNIKQKNNVIESDNNSFYDNVKEHIYKNGIKYLFATAFMVGISYGIKSFNGSNNS